MQVLSALVVATTFHDSARYRESETRYSAIHAEYPTWLYLTAENAPVMTADVLDSHAMQEVFDLLDEIAAATQSYYTIKAQIAAASPATAEDDVLIRARNWNLFVRSPSYEHHNRAQLEELFQPFATELRGILGFGVDEALGADPATIDPGQQELLERFRRSGDPSKAAMAAAMTWAQTYWHTGFVVTPDQVAEQSKLEVGVAQRILARFSTPFGQPRRASDWPSVEDRLERAPLIDRVDGSWWVGLVPKFAWAIAPALEEALAGKPGCLAAAT